MYGLRRCAERPSWPSLVRPAARRRRRGRRRNDALASAPRPLGRWSIASISFVERRRFPKELSVARLPLGVRRLQVAAFVVASLFGSSAGWAQQPDPRALANPLV
jgi:hypothetical protein